MSDFRQAVFLSYASQDADAARRICDALRAAGVEVWFDQSELRGGDAWDAKIRKQIKECALFVPVISANTQARREGYFRIEWKLAAQRTHAIAEGTPFLVPIIVGDVAEPEALVPAEFREVQWTLLRPAGYGGKESNDGGVAAFCDRVRDLLDPGTRASASLSFISAGGTPPPPSKRALRRAFVCTAAATVVAGIVAIRWLRPPATKSPPVSPPAAKVIASTTPLEAVAGPRLGSKSIAVLPFENLSADKDNDAFFADGIHEDILTNLSSIRDLHVVSRTSVMQYRGTTKPLPEIARELGVAYILEGSVRRAGNKVRVTGQLINGKTDEHLWAKPYDRDLTDVFAIQSELAQAIAGELKAAISPGEKMLIEKPPTRNIAAYELVLKARALVNESNGPGINRPQIVPLLRQAVQLDPGFGAAYAWLAYVEVYAGGRPPDAKARAKEAIDVAIRVDPDSPDVIRGLGDYYYYGTGDFSRAMEQYRTFIRLRPSDSDGYNRIASVQRRHGDWLDSTANFRRGKDLDPNNFNNIDGLAGSLLAGRRYVEALTEYRYAAQRRPADLSTQFYAAYVPFLAIGSTQEVENVFQSFPAEQRKGVRREWALRSGQLDEAIRLDQSLGASLRGRINSVASVGIDIAAALMARGQTDAARARVSDLEGTLRRELEADPTNPRLWSYLGCVLALLGQKDEALRCGRKAVELVPVSRDVIFGNVARAELAFIYTWTQERDAAIAEYADILNSPWCFMFAPTPDCNVHVMKCDPRYAPLRGHPRFEALLNDPKNNAPLF